MNYDDMCNGPVWVNAADLAGAAEHFKAKADTVLRLHGQAAPAIHPDENMADYRRRLLGCVRPHTEGRLRDVDTSKLHPSMLDNFERTMINDTVTAFKRPTGPLRMATERDDAGRAIRRFYGDPENCWGVFKPPVQNIATFTPGIGRGADSPHARGERAAAAAMEKRFEAFVAAERAAAGVVD